MRSRDEPNRVPGNARPRHIRDIAHLYLSRRKVTQFTAAPPHIHVYLTSQDAGCLSGFHAANIAAAFAQCKTSVKVYELSGLLPNASFFFGHPAALYLDLTEQGRRKLLPAVPGVTIAFRTAARPRVQDVVHAGSGARPTVHLYHLPPESDRARWRDLDDTLNALGWRVCLMNGGQAAERATAGLPLHGTFVVAVGGGGESPGDPAVAAVIEDWHWALVDRMPVVLRDPASRLARAYTATCESLLARMGTQKRIEHAATEPRVFASGRARR